MDVLELNDSLTGGSPEATVVSYLLVLMRIATFVAFLPIFDRRRVPHLVKMGLVVALAAIWGSSTPAIGQSPMLQQCFEGNWFALAAISVREVLFGGSLGFAFGMLLEPARIAGAYLGQEMGLTMAITTDPTSGNTQNVMSDIFEALAILLFLVLDVHHFFFYALHLSLEKWPVGGQWSLYPVWQMARDAGHIHQWGLLIAAPAGICMFLALIALAVLMKASPQVNIFSVGFALRLGVGMVAVVMFLPAMLYVLQQVFGRASNILQHLWLI